MYMQRAAIVWVGALMGFLACSPGPSAGTSTTSIGATSSTGGGSGGTGGMDAGTCSPREDYYEFCGDCRRCLEVKCCAEIIACEDAPGCLDCVSHKPDAAGPCGQDAQLFLEGCSGECGACHSPTPNPGCFLDAGPG